MTKEHDSERRESEHPSKTPGSSSKKPSSLDHEIEEKFIRRRTAKRDEGESKDTEPAVKLTPLQSAEQEFRKNPLNTKLALDLVKLYLEEDRAYDAERVLRTVAEMTDNDAAICDRLDEVRLLRSRQKVQNAEKLAEVQGTQTARDKLDAARADHAKLELEIMRRRAERKPDDKKVRFELGMQLKKLDKHEEAIACFEAVCDEPQLKPAAILKIGECRQLARDFHKALQLYRDSIKAAEEAGRSECRKIALYRAGVLAAAMKELPEAKQHFKALVDLDAQFKDAAKRLGDLEKSGG